MRASEILGRGVQETKFEDKTYSHNGRPDFQAEDPEVKTFGPMLPKSRPRTKASQNNSYT